VLAIAVVWDNYEADQPAASIKRSITYDTKGPWRASSLLPAAVRAGRRGDNHDDRRSQVCTGALR